MICVSESPAKNLVLGKLQSKAVRRPTDLLILLDEGLSYADIQEALAELLYEGRIVLTSDRQLAAGTLGTTGTLDESSRKR